MQRMGRREQNRWRSAAVTNTAASCEVMREAISSSIDGEEAGVSVDAREVHLAACPGCRRWRTGAHEVTRLFRLEPAGALPVPSRSLLAAIGRRAVAARLGREELLSRLCLALVALAQLAVAVPALLLGTDHGAPIHVAHEMGSFDLALAAGFLVAAWRPSRARGMQTIVGVAALLLVLTALIDLGAARTTVGDEAPHLLAVAGWLLLHRLSMLTPSPSEMPVTIGSLFRGLRGDARRSARWRAEPEAVDPPARGIGDPDVQSPGAAPAAPRLPAVQEPRPEVPEAA